MPDPTPAPAPARGPIRIAPIEAPTRESVRPLPANDRPLMQPYRVLFPIGAVYAAIGVLLWAVAAVRGGWPWDAHALLLLQGFELSFVTGFLLSAMPAFTHGAPCSAAELWTTAAALALVGPLWALGLPGFAHAASFVALGSCATAVARRLRFGGASPPEEFGLVGVGVSMGLVGIGWQALVAFGLASEPTPRFAERLLSRGMVLCLVLGLGGLLATTFMMMRDPIRILGVSAPGERPRRRAFLALLGLSFVGAMVLEGMGHARAASIVRAVAGVASLALAWKLQRLPGRRERLSWTLWAAGVCVGTGLVSAAIWPAHEIALWHFVFAGGYGLLTAGIATRVVCSHGGHGMEVEPRVLTAWVVGLLAAGVALRVGAEWAGARQMHVFAGAAIAWGGGWLAWLALAWPRVRRTKRGLLMPEAPGPKRHD